MLNIVHMKHIKTGRITVNSIELEKNTTTKRNWFMLWISKLPELNPANKKDRIITRLPYQPTVRDLNQPLDPYQSNAWHSDWWHRWYSYCRPCMLIVHRWLHAANYYRPIAVCYLLAKRKLFFLGGSVCVCMCGRQNEWRREKSTALTVDLE